jgi:hypothetical protein
VIVSPYLLCNTGKTPARTSLQQQHLAIRKGNRIKGVNWKEITLNRTFYPVCCASTSLGQSFLNSRLCNILLSINLKGFYVTAEITDIVCYKFDNYRQEK